MRRLTLGSRVVLCGLISGYNNPCARRFLSDPDPPAETFKGNEF